MQGRQGQAHDARCAPGPPPRVGRLPQRRSFFSATCVRAAPPTPARQRSAFMSDAAAIGREIKSTAEKLERLSKRARASPLFLQLAS